MSDIDNCKATLELHEDQVLYLKKQLEQKNYKMNEVAIAIINADDINGAIIAANLSLAPNREKTSFVVVAVGKMPFAEGIEFYDPEAARKMREEQNLTAIVIDYGTVQVFKV